MLTHRGVGPGLVKDAILVGGKATGPLAPGSRPLQCNGYESRILARTPIAVGGARPRRAVEYSADGGSHGSTEFRPTDCGCGSAAL